MHSAIANPPVQTAFAPAQRAQDDVFQRSRFLLRQKHFTLSEKYHVWGDAGEKLLFVERPAYHLRSVLALLGGLGAFAVVAILTTLVAAVLPEAIRAGVAVVGIFVLGLGAAIATAVALSAKRHVSFFRDETKRELLLRVEQDSKFQFPTTTYTVKDPAGTVLALLSKNHLYDVIRKRWYCNSPAGQLLCVVKEDSILNSIARRLIGPALGLLRTNFVFLSNEREFGRFDRQLTLLDRYVLDVSGDANGILDRRVALAIGVMLDTGEKR